MKEAAENPELTEEHHDLAERKMTRIRDLHAKRKMVEASKKELPKKDSVKSKKDSNKIIIEVDKNENKLLYSDKLKHLIYKIKNQDINTDKVTFGW